MQKVKEWSGVVALVAIILVLIVGQDSQPEPQLGGGSRFPNGISADSTSPVAGEIRGTTLTLTSGASITGALTQGGGITATSTSGNAVPLLSTDFDTENVIDVTLNLIDATLSFPATSTLTSFIPTAGQTRTLFVRNASTTAAMDLTVSGGTGVVMKFASTTPATTGVITGDTDGANFALIVLTRKANTDIEALVSLFKD